MSPGHAALAALRPVPTLLIVEDDLDTRRLNCSMISRIFPDLVIYDAENGRRGLELYKKHSPDVIITDINMPEMDGIEMVQEIRSLNSVPRIIVLTGYSDKAYLERFDAIGIRDYILKPVEFKKLVTAIEQSIAEIRRERQASESPAVTGPSA